MLGSRKGCLGTLQEQGNQGSVRWKDVRLTSKERPSCRTYYTQSRGAKTSTFGRITSMLPTRNAYRENAREEALLGENWTQKGAENVRKPFGVEDMPFLDKNT